MVQVLGPGMMRGTGVVLQRGPVPQGVTRPLPATLTIQSTPYQAPPQISHGGMRYDSQPAQDFIHQYLKGCNPDPGTLHSYNDCDR